MPPFPGFERAFNPRAVAFLGASRTDPAKFGNTFIRAYQHAGFPGAMYAVNPQPGGDILGVKTYTSLREISEPIDLAMAVVPASGLETLFRECAEVGAPNLHLWTAGFEETGTEEGIRMGAYLKELAHKLKLNIIGPNSTGIFYNSRARICMRPELDILEGGLSLVSQSGMHCVFTAFNAVGRGLGLSKVISSGNCWVLDTLDYLEYLATDVDTRIIALYLEGATRDAADFLQMARRINPEKPIILYKGGLTEDGARAARSHTASLAGKAELWQAFIRQTGVIQVSSIDEIVDVGLAFTLLPPPNGNRVCIITAGGGGSSVYATDGCAAEGLSVPPLGDSAQDILRSLVPAEGTSIRNPLDAPVLMSDEQGLARALEAVMADPVIDMVLLYASLGPVAGVSPGELLAEAIGMARRSGQNQKPVAVCLRHWDLGPDSLAIEIKMRQRLLREQVPVYPSLDSSARALARFAEWHRYQRDLAEA